MDRLPDEIDYRYIVHYKTYPRFNKISLINNLPDTPLGALLSNRRTRRVSSNKELSIKLLHPLLAMATGRTGKNDGEEDFRAYPSAGARYPLELYLFSFTVKDMDSGIYHFSPLDNSLEILWEGDLKLVIKNLFNEENKEEIQHEFLENMKAFVAITAIEERTTFKYGAAGKKFPLIEAGYLGANITIMLEEAGYNPVILGTQWCSKELGDILDINPEKESVISSIAIL